MTPSLRCSVPLFCCIAVCLSLSLWLPRDAYAARVKDLTSIAGVRDNQLLGYGLVVGLNGTGDGNNTGFSGQTVSTMLRTMGLTIDAAKIHDRNAAAFMATATLPPFARAGGHVDVLVSSTGDAKSLQGGTLLLTPLRAPNGQIYAVAQGPVSIGGFAVSGKSGSKVQQNHPTVGQITNGALIEGEVGLQFNGREHIRMLLNNPDFTTSARLASTINTQLGTDVARAVDSGTIEVQVLEPYRANVAAFVATLENMELIPDQVAKVVLDERTGTVVIGENVRIATVAVADGNLSIENRQEPQVAQPAPPAQRKTAITSKRRVKVKEDKSQVILLPQAVTIRDLVRALNSIGVTPRDLVAIFQAIKAAGALQAKLEIM